MSKFLRAAAVVLNVAAALNINNPFRVINVIVLATLALSYVFFNNE